MKILITGASSGIGYDAAKTLAQKGHTVFAAARRVSQMETLRPFGATPLFLDVTDEQSIQSCLAQVGDVDALVNCAGYGSFGAIENVPLEEARRQLEVNLFGLARLCQLVLPGMRKRGRGRIVNIGSVAGKGCLYFGGWYHVSKYAVEAFSDCLRMEMKPFGIDVVLIEPGATRTEWGQIAARHLEASSKGTAYEEPALRQAFVLKKGFSPDVKFLSAPSVVTRAIVKGVCSRHPRTRYRVSTGSDSMVFWHAVLPDRWWDGIVRQLASPWLARFAEKL